MSYSARPTAILPSGPGSLRQPGSGSISAQQSSALQSRINAKKAELEDLKHLRELSGALAGQMSELQDKLSTLRDGTEAVACVLANWDNVLRAISLASAKVPISTDRGDTSKDPQSETTPHFPQTLVRIPAQPRTSYKAEREGEIIRRDGH
ncbi:MAG: hypothetical protein Q9227_003976 [Pyrenula ochraceoflavens]